MRGRKEEHHGEEMRKKGEVGHKEGKKVRAQKRKERKETRQ